MSQGYQYFALQKVNTATSQGYCAVSNSQPTATSLGESLTVNGSVALWSSNTSGQTGNTATLTNTGSLNVLNTSLTVVHFPLCDSSVTSLHSINLPSK